MQTYTELQSELLSRLQVADNSTLYTTTRVQSLIKDAYMWATSIYLWPELEKAKTTSTSTAYYYDYPSDFKTDSITRVIIDTKEYDRKAFEDFLDYKDKNPTDTNTRIFADHGRQVFIFPTPTAGSSNFDIWGLVQATQLSLGADVTIFSSHDDAGNEAVVKKALSVALAKINKAMAQQEEAEAKGILGTIYGKILQRQQRDQRLDHARFEVPNFFGKQVGNIGKFSV